jgi:hypothetical protein
MVGHLLPRIDRLDGKSGLSATGFSSFDRNDALFGPGLRSSQLNLEPTLQLPLR